MPFNPSLTDPISRIRLALGDTGEPSLLAGGETTYTALLSINGGDAHAAMRQAAAALATFYATEPSRLSNLGRSIAWEERIDQWNKIATGAIDELPPDPTAPPVPHSGPLIGRLVAGSGWRPR